MTLEAATYIHQLNSSYPEGSADRSTADDHLRLIKSCVQATFPNVAGVVSVTHTQLNLLTGLTDTLTAILNRFSLSISANTADIARLSQTVSVVIADVARISQTVSVVVADVAKLSLSVSAAVADVAKLSLSVSALNTEVSNLSLSISAVKASISAIQTDTTKFSLSISAIKSSISAIQTDTSKFSLSISALNTAVASAGMSVGTADTLTSSNVAFTGISASARRITLVIDGEMTISTSTGGPYLNVVIGDSGGYESTSYVFTLATLRASDDSDSAKADVVRQTSDARWSVCGHADNFGANGFIIQGGHIVLHNISGNLWHIDAQFTGSFSTSTALIVTMSGSKELSATLDRVMFFRGVGNFTSGLARANIYVE